MSTKATKNTTESAAVESVFNANESTMIATINRRFIAKLEAKKHTLWLGNVSGVDMFGVYALKHDNGQFPVLRDGMGYWVSVESIDLTNDSLMIAVQLDGFGIAANGLRGGRETLTNPRTSLAYVPVKIAYDAESEKFSAESVGDTLYRYSKMNGWSEVNESFIGRNFPGMVASGVVSLLTRKVRAFVSNNAAKVDNREVLRNGAKTLYGRWIDQKDAGK